MAFYDRAKMSTATTGTGTITLGSALPGFQSFAAAGVANGASVRYVIEDGTSWEIGLGVYTTSGTTLTRVPVESSNAGAAITLDGLAVAYATVAAADLAGFAPLASPTFTGTPSLPTGTTAVTQTAGNNTTALATTAFDTAAVATETSRATTAEALLAPKASPALTGTPTAPTATVGTSTTQVATTAFANAAGVTAFNTRTGAVTLAAADVSTFFTTSLTSNGYQIAPDGTIMQWGVATTAATGLVSVTFPHAFPNACLRGMASVAGTAVSNLSASVGSLATSSMTLVLSNASTAAGVAGAVAWFAIGW
jgi:hypothetical protein